MFQDLVLPSLEFHGCFRIGSAGISEFMHVSGVGTSGLFSMADFRMRDAELSAQCHKRRPTDQLLAPQGNGSGSRGSIWGSILPNEKKRKV